MSEFALAGGEDAPQEHKAEGLAPGQPLVRLRDDLQLRPGPRDHRGHPTWTLHDPLRNKFFQLDEHFFHIISCWQQGTPAAIIAAVAAQSAARPTLDDISAALEFLVNSELLECNAPPLRVRLQRLAGAREQSLWARLLHGYLFFRVPLLRPDPILERWYPLVRPLLGSRFLLFSALVGLVSLVLVLRQWEAFFGAMPWFFTTEGVLVMIATLAVVKVLHEFGHAFTCRKFGLRVPTMGVAFMVMWPVLYTDATDAWRLTSRRQRALISGAGVTVELVLACYALAAWLMLPDGLLRSVALTVATTAVVMSLAVNLNPLMRFDGYYFLSDMLNVPNLQDRSFELARWRLRGWLFGDTGPAPALYEPRLERFLTWYAFAVWIYRFVLFLGIALLVYHLFFKALGVFLFAVEIWYFILRPIQREVQHWPGLWQTMGALRKRRWFMLGGGLLLVLLFPWQQVTVAPAQWVDARFLRVYPARPALVEDVAVRNGEQVQPGQLLLRMRSPDLDAERQRAMLDVQRLRSLLDRSIGDAELVSERLVAEQALARAEATVVALDRVAAQLVVHAPFAGVVTDLLPDLHAGRWVGQGTHLGTLRAGQQARVTAWVREDRVSGLAVGDAATFHAEMSGIAQSLPLRIVAIERAAVTELESPYPASVHGGDLPVSRGPGGALVPDVAVYRVYLVPGDGLEELPAHRLRGWVHLEGERRTLLGRLFRLLAGTLVREAGF